MQNKSSTDSKATPDTSSKLYFNKKQNNKHNSIMELKIDECVFPWLISIISSIIFRFLFFTSFILLQGCNDPLEKLINSNFPSINIDRQKQMTIDSNADALSSLASPNVAFSVYFTDAEKILLVNFKKIGVKKIDIKGENQFLKITISFDRQFNEKDALDNPALAKQLSILKPHIIGEVTIFSGITGGVTNFDIDKPTLDIKILPAFSSVNVKKIELAEKYDLTREGELLTLLLNKYKNNITGIISKIKLTSIEIPAISKEYFDITKNFKSNNPNLVINLSAQPVNIPFKLDGLAWLITDKQLTSIVQLSPIAVTNFPTKKINIEHSFDGVKKRIDEIVEQVLEVPDAKSHTWVAIKKDVIAISMNNVIQQASACLIVNGELFNQHLETTVAMPNGSGISCTTNRNCDPNRICTFNANRDERDCGTCILRTPRVCTLFGCIGGQCSLRGQDPVCQLQKEAQQALYNIDANARKADCDRLRETERLTCQAEVTAEKALCDAKKSALDALGKTGNFANLTVDASLYTKGMKACMKNFTMSSALDNVQFSVEVLGTANAHVDLRFMPLDAGHLVCPIKWQKILDLHGELTEKIISTSMNVVIQKENTGFSTNFTTDTINLKTRMNPGPTELLLRNPDLLVKCPVIQFVAPVVVVLTPFIPQLRGDFDVSLPAQNASFLIPETTLKIDGHVLTFKTETTKEAIVHSAYIDSKTLKFETTSNHDKL
ncbi:TPA: hypothetical protein RUZ98_000957 [Klebsiella pneumoniae]|uniref:hypothetical protein n=1 Tax=Klebsiella variicola TaxID=244366 RepID=UPI001033E998|nr:hypothetical protein [Klebsiella variicola]HDZ9517926.1 hypothetical protein [Klebsiella pneumoniae]